MQTLHQSLCHVIPPHILKHIAEECGNADAATREEASETLVQMAMAGNHEGHAPEETAVALTGKRRNVYDAQHLQKLPGKLVRSEHTSDAFGIMVKQATLGLTAADSDWIIGEGLFGPSVHGKGIRSMAAPGTAYDDPVLGRDPQPAHMRDYVVTTDDNGGVHINSGIPNHAFYLAAIAMGGPPVEVVGPIWYWSLLHLDTVADFAAFARTTTSM